MAHYRLRILVIYLVSESRIFERICCTKWIFWILDIKELVNSAKFQNYIYITLSIQQISKTLVADKHSVSWRQICYIYPDDAKRAEIFYERAANAQVDVGLCCLHMP